MDLSKKTTQKNNTCLLLCLMISIWLCVAQVLGSTFLILPCLLCYLALTIWSGIKGMALPVLLFFLPWATLLKTEPGTMSFFTIALFLVCMILLINNNFRIKYYYIIPAVFLVGITFISKFADGNSIDNSYILFMAFVLLLPMLSKEIGDKYDFFYLTAFFSLGIILAALSAQQLAVFPTIAEYIDVYTFKDITRLSGYYGDPNFYSAHITAAVSGVLLLILREKKTSRRFFLMVLAVVLLYCGMLSASKTFVVVMISIILFWCVEMLFMRGRISFKFSLILAIVIVCIFVLSSSVFSDLVDVIILRFADNTDMSTLTTGRTELWISYFDAFKSDLKLIMLGKGYTNVLVNEAASHNTLIQMLYQFGLMGLPFLIAWIICFARKTLRFCKVQNKIFLGVLILVIGTFGPWLALDILFFDEFFLMQFYVYAGISWLYSKNNENQEKSTDLPTNGEVLQVDN